MGAAMPKKQAISKLVAEVLDGTELKLVIDEYQLSESFETGEIHVRCEVHDTKTGEKSSIEGTGVGLIDAVFRGLRGRYASDYPSLDTIRFSDFSIKANVETGVHEDRSDMAAKVELEVVNSNGLAFEFSHASPSITASSLCVVLDAVGFFINSERAFLAVYRALEHAKDENRHDSVERYTRQLSTLVESTSYSDVIEQVKSGDA